MQGRLVPGMLPSVLRSLHGGRRTGELKLTYGESRSALFFIRGHLVRGEASVTQLHMGEVMVAHGLLTKDALELATLRVIAEHKRLGQALIDLNLMSHEQVEQGLALHICEILTDAFCWKDGKYAFEEAAPETESGNEDHPLRESTGDLVIGAVRSIPSREVILHALGSLDRVLLPASDPFLRFQRLTLTPVDGFVLSRVDGASTARDVLSVTPLPAETVEHSLLALVCAGLVEFATDAPPKARDSVQFLRQEILDAHAALATREPHAILGIPAGSAPSDVKAAYFRLARRYHPDIQHDPALSDLGDKLETLFFRITAAYESLSAPPSRLREKQAGAALPVEADPPPVMVDVEDLYGRAEERFGEGKFWEAIALLTEVVNGAKGRVRSRARLLLARAYLKYPEHAKTAERELLAALQEDAQQPEIYYVLGTVYKRGGLASRATAMFRRAVELNPRYRAALAELEPGLPAPPPGPGRKRFGRG